MASTTSQFAGFEAHFRLIRKYPYPKAKPFPRRRLPGLRTSSRLTNRELNIPSVGTAERWEGDHPSSQRGHAPRWSLSVATLRDLSDPLQRPHAGTPFLALPSVATLVGCTFRLYGCTVAPCLDSLSPPGRWYGLSCHDVGAMASSQAVMARVAAQHEVLGLKSGLLGDW